MYSLGAVLTGVKHLAVALWGLTLGCKHVLALFLTGVLVLSLAAAFSGVAHLIAMLEPLVARCWLEIAHLCCWECQRALMVQGQTRSHTWARLTLCC